MTPWSDRRSDHIGCSLEVGFVVDRVLQEQVLRTGFSVDRPASLAAESNDPINVFVSSPGGHVESGDMIHDIVKFIEPRVRMIGSGWVASAGALIFVSVPLEDRVCLPNTRFLLHQPSGGMGGQASDIAIQAEQILKMKQRLNEIFPRATGQPLERVEKDTERDYWMTTDEAISYGLVSRVVQSSRDLD